MRPDGVKGGAPAPAMIAFRDLDVMHSDMEDRPRDLGFFHLLADARDSKGEISLIGKNVFRAEQKSPSIDKVIIFSEGLAVELERRQG